MGWVQGTSGLMKNGRINYSNEQNLPSGQAEMSFIDNSCMKTKS